VAESEIRVGAVTTISLRRLKGDSGSDVSLAPTQAAVKRILPTSFTRPKYEHRRRGRAWRHGCDSQREGGDDERTVRDEVMLDSLSPEDLVRFIAEAKVTAHSNTRTSSDLRIGRRLRTSRFFTR